jgi:SAM-dependent methyltransferase
MTELSNTEKIEERFQRLYLDEYTITHKKRLALSYDLLSKYTISGEEHILETGDTANFKDFVLGDKPHVKFDSIDIDFRNYMSKVGAQYDIVLGLEVLEHIKDQNDGAVNMFEGSGVKVFMDECYRMLKSGGVLILTTPNAHSLDNIEKVLTYQAPMLFRPHVREYTMHEVEELATSAGFQIEAIYSLDVWDNTSRTWRKQVESLATDAGMDQTKWGQDIFLVARKPHVV